MMQQRTRYQHGRRNGPRVLREFYAVIVEVYLRGLRPTVVTQTAGKSKVLHGPHPASRDRLSSTGLSSNF